jgi:MoaA/NifB/PqqE/SkfB family radical SAM enzyme
MKRVDIKTGYLCNNNCLFCVQAHNKSCGNRTTAEIKNSLDIARKKGCDEVVFTGGEVTIRKDVFEIVEYAKKIGFDHIQIQTNGRMFSNINFVKKLIKLGVNEFSPAIHGHNAELHDSLTRAKGAFSQVIQGLKNLQRLKQKVVTNSVITKKNYMYLKELAQLLVDHGVLQYQLAFMHANGNALDNFDEMMPDLKTSVPHIKKGLQVGIDNNVGVMAEAMAYCTMKHYERYVSEIYIPFSIVVEKNVFRDDFMTEKVIQGKKKFSFCKDCKYFHICEGPWREYPERKGESEFKAIPVKK